MEPPPDLTTRADTLPRIPTVDADDAGVRSRVHTPVKRIQDDTDLAYWAKSKSHAIYLLFVTRLAHASRGKATRLAPQQPTHVISIAEAARIGPCEGLLALLDEIDEWTRDIEPLKTPQRFGNLAFREWGRRLDDRVESLHNALLPSNMQPFIVELKAYLCDSFGSFVRLDYGSGHELAFCAWLCSLTQLGFLSSDPATEERLALEVYPRYLAAAWALQDRYGLEPAGSHGVWGLDDFHFLSYVFGAAQLENEQEYLPTAVATSSHRPATTPLTSRELLDFLPSHTNSGGAAPRSFGRSAHSSDVSAPPPFRNLYTSSIARIHSLKRGPFAEHSPILSDIASSVPSWHKVASGMLKMYDEEVLKKRPVVQHFFFGPTFFAWDGTGAEEASKVKEGDVSVRLRRGADAQPATPAPWAKATSAPGERMTMPSTGAPWAVATGLPPRGTAAPWARQAATLPKR